MSHVHADIIIVGSGIAGCALALGLAQQTDLSILLMDAKAPIADEPIIGARVSALIQSSVDLFIHLNVWQDIHAQAASFTSMMVWDENSQGVLNFERARGFIIENHVMRNVLLKAIAKHPRIQCHYPVQIQDIFCGEQQVLLETDRGSFQARLLIGADGADSFVRQHTGFEWTEKPYHHTAIIATVTTEKPHENKARQRFLREGILAFLPLHDPHQSSIVWSLSPERANEVMALDTAALHTTLGAAFQYQLGAIKAVTPLTAFPLVMRHVKNYVRPRVVLVADAAHTIHPLAGQGLNMGLSDVAALITAIKTARVFDDVRYLRPFARERKAKNARIIFLMYLLKNSFACDNIYAAAGRSLVMQAIDRHAGIKDYVCELIDGKREW